MKAVVAAFNQEKALVGAFSVGAFSVIVQPVVEPMDRFAALLYTVVLQRAGAGWVQLNNYPSHLALLTLLLLLPSPPLEFNWICHLRLLVPTLLGVNTV